MANVSDIQIDRGSIEGVIAEIRLLEGKYAVALLAVTEAVAFKMEEWAKNNKRWKDISSNAVDGLTGKAYWENAHTLVCSISHTMDYGVWLELAHEKKYAILEESIEQNKDSLLEAWSIIVGGRL